MKKYAVMFCDLYDTLVHRNSQNMWDITIRPEALDAICKMSPQYFFIVTNNGSLHGSIEETEFSHVLDWLSSTVHSYILNKTGNDVICDSAFCPSISSQYAKPNSGMLNIICKSYDLFEYYTKEDMIMIGDASGINGGYSIDFDFAKNFEICYCDINELIKMLNK